MGKTLWNIKIHRKANKTLNRLHGKVLNRLRQAINALAEDPHPSGSKKMIGHKDLYRIRVGDWRIVYKIENGELIILILAIASRGEIYKNY